MKIVVLNGSPKGDLSLTLQYVHFIEEWFPQHEFKIFEVSKQMNTVKINEKLFMEIIDEVKAADGVLWSFPLYIALVAAQYKKFIELIFEKKVTAGFENKYTAVLTTSIKFMDHIAHNYMQAICDDLNMKYVSSFSAEMDDLLKEKEQNRLITFAANFFNTIQNNRVLPKYYSPIMYHQLDYLPGKVENPIDQGTKKIIILTEVLPVQKNLLSMIERFKNSFVKKIEIINLNDMDIKGGCLECYRCGYDNTCIYAGKDEFINTYNFRLKEADILVFAGVIEDRFLSSKWKLFFDRGFFNSHTPSFTGKQIGFIISGPLRQIPNLKEMLEGYSQWQRANLAGIITDEYDDSVIVDGIIDNFAQNLVTFADKNYVQPMTFLGVGGIKILRDDVWGKLRFIWRADHRYYKKNGIYDFPQKDYKTRITNAVVMLLMKIPRFRNEFYKVTQSEMIKPFQKIIDKQMSLKRK
jgi:multimeric flavodoxin WrbA